MKIQNAKPLSGPCMIAALCASVLLAACGGSDDAGNAEQKSGLAAAREAISNTAGAAGAMKQMGTMLEEVAKNQEEGVTIDPVDFRELRDLLPERIGSLERTEIQGERNNTMGMAISTATAEYRGSDGESSTPYLKLTVTDLGGIQGMALMALAPWSMVTIDKETSTGHERTGKYEGFPSHEEFDDDGSPAGEMQVFVASRFLVAVEGRNMPWEQIRDAVGAVNLKKLEGMKEVGVTRSR